ncbi:hypothetical protein K438DRAFT_445208 [Mycena galopus ATCC 62051]|nr:hypothetical protein K438DRAFT_445208 [Mycena galopus ATCC 62051]
MPAGHRFFGLITCPHPHVHAPALSIDELAKLFPGRPAPTYCISTPAFLFFCPATLFSGFTPSLCYCFCFTVSSLPTLRPPRSFFRRFHLRCSAFYSASLLFMPSLALRCAAHHHLLLHPYHAYFRFLVFSLPRPRLIRPRPFHVLVPQEFAKRHNIVCTLTEADSQRSKTQLPSLPGLCLSLMLSRSDVCQKTRTTQLLRESNVQSH